MGDGECNEGSVREAVMSAPKFELDNLVLFIDNNRYQQTGSNDEILKNQNLKIKFENFGWDAYELDGHDVNNLYKTINELNLKIKNQRF